MVLKWCLKERKKNQVNKESQQNRSRWWICSRNAAKRLLMCYFPLHQKVRGKPDMKVNFFWARKLSSIKEREDFWTLTHQATQNGMLINFVFSRVEIWWIEQGDLLYSHSTRTDSLLKTIIWILTPKQNQKCRQNSDHSCTGWMIKCERGRTNPQKMQQKTATNIFCDIGNVYVFCIASICIHGAELLGQFAVHQKYRRSHTETDVREIWEIDIRTIRRDLWNK